MSSKSPRRSTAKSASSTAAGGADQSADVPRYEQFVRSEARLRPDQLSGLAELRRRLQSSRQDRSERLTDNTLIRVAVDALLSQADDVTGDTEDQIRDSVVNKSRK